MKLNLLAGIPQSRERVVIVGTRADLGVPWSFPAKTHSEDRSLWEMYVTGGENMIRYQDGSDRYFTVCEAKRIQIFPDNFVIKGACGEAMRQIGNAVPVLLG